MSVLDDAETAEFKRMYVQGTPQPDGSRKHHVSRLGQSRLLILEKLGVEFKPGINVVYLAAAPDRTTYVIAKRDAQLLMTERAELN